MSLTVDEIVTYRTDLLEYSKYILKARKGVDFIENYHHKLICEFLEKIVIGDIKRAIINIPPSYSKTELAVVNFVSWCVGNFPTSEFILTSYSSSLSTNNSYNARSVLELQEYKNLFPDIKLRVDSKAKNHWKTENGATVYSAGSYGTITGYHAGGLNDKFNGALIIDDPLKAEDSNSVIMRNNVNNWFLNTIKSRLKSRNTPIILIMQRLHQDDLTGFLLNGGDGEKWDRLCIPAINSDGTALWEHKHTIDDLKKLQNADRFVFSSQYLQEPIIKGGNLIKESNFKYYQKQYVYNFDRIGIYVDTANKTKEQNDYSVFQCWGLKDGNIYKLDQLRGKWEAPELIKNALVFYQKCKKYGHIYKFAVEDKQSGTTLIQFCKRNAIPIQEISRGKGQDKIQRCNNNLAYFDNGLIYLEQDCEDNQEYITELTAFPSGKHDDQLDPTLDAIEDLLYENTVSFAFMSKFK